MEKPHRWWMVSMLAFSVEDHEFESRSGQTKDYKICISCFSAKHAALRSKSNDWLPRNQNNVSKWNAMSTCGLLFQWASTIKIQLSMLVLLKADLNIISLNLQKCNLFSPWYCWKIAHLVLNNNHLNLLRFRKKMITYKKNYIYKALHIFENALCVN